MVHAILIAILIALAASLIAAMIGAALEPCDQDTNAPALRCGAEDLSNCKPGQSA